MQYEQATPINSNWQVSVKEYRDYPALNFHKLLDFHRDPRAFREGFFDDREETDAMRFGTALHALVLQGENAYNETVGVFNAPINPKTGEPYGATTKAYAEARAAFLATSGDKTLISSEDDKTIRKLYDELLFHPNAPIVLGRKWYQTEIPVKGFATFGDDKIEIKGLIDRYSDAGLVDVKTTAALTDASGRDQFRYAIYSYKYLIQLAFYQKILCECYDAPYMPCWIVAFEKNPPNRVAVYSIAEDVMEKARFVVDEWIKDYVKATKNDRYEGRFEQAQLIDCYDYERDLY